MGNKLEELKQQYLRVPNELKEMKRWVCYCRNPKVIEGYNDNRPYAPKTPFNALTGRPAQSNNELTWSKFNIAIMGCEKYGFDGIGFMLGNGIFGVDLDNHGDISESEFKEISSEFVSQLNSYTELSQSGKGIHIICKGKLPEGGNRKGNVEMYETGRYFAMTGNVVVDMPIEERTNEILPLWQKYVETKREIPTMTVVHPDGSITFGNSMSDFAGVQPLGLSDTELIERIKASSGGDDFIRLYNGDMTEYGNDHSRADFAFCMKLAFWTGKDAYQMDRIFRSSALMREKWDRPQKNSTYGGLQIEKAIEATMETYHPAKERVELPPVIEPKGNNSLQDIENTPLNIDEKGDPIIKVNNKKTFKTYTLDDTGNAERLYDYFGHLFKYNESNKYFMFWNSKTWVVDGKEYIRKYADELIRIMRDETDVYEQQLIKDAENGDATESEIERRTATLKAMQKNVARLGNKAGKDAMISEFSHLHDIPVENTAFDKEDYLLNTESGIVDMRTGEIMPFDPKYMLSLNTNCKVRFEEPTTWLKFLNDIFQRGNQEETDELIDCIQKCLGYSFTASSKQQCMFFLYGDGSNGKSTFTETVMNIAGDYGTVTDSENLMAKQAGSAQSTQFSLAKLMGTRFVNTSETEKGKKLAEAKIKEITGSTKIEAQFKYGKPFEYVPKFKIWLSTNNKPAIRGNDYGIWRRIFMFPFERRFTEKEKDVNMPDKLAKEMPQILGWIIRGFQKLWATEDKLIQKPKCIEEALANYRKENDVVYIYLNSQCTDFAEYKTKASILYQDYKTWAMNNTEQLMSETEFGMEISKKGYRKVRRSDGNYYVGLKLNSDSRGHKFGE